MNVKQLAAEIIRPLMPLLPRGRHALHALFGSGDRDDKPWIHCKRPFRVFWDRQINAWVSCDLKEWGGRWHYYQQEYYDKYLPWILKNFLHSGDTFIDIGANKGIFTMQASSIVGDSGTVIAFEPNPRTANILRSHLIMNGIEKNVDVIEKGLGSVVSEFDLNILDLHSGTATIRQINDKDVSSTIKVPVVTADSILMDRKLTGKIFLKIDVEGLELEVLKGAENFIQKFNPEWVYVEVSPQWLEERNQSAIELIEFMKGCGYLISKSPIKKYHLYLWPKIELVDVTEPPTTQTDLLFIK